MTDETFDPVLVALFGKLDHQRGIVKHNEKFVQDAAAQIKEHHERKRKAEGEVEALVKYLSENFPGWEDTFDHWKDPDRRLRDGE